MDDIAFHDLSFIKNKIFKIYTTISLFGVEMSRHKSKYEGTSKQTPYDDPLEVNECTECHRSIVQKKATRNTEVS